MQSTTNYQLVKQELTDKADITQISGNWDIIDTQLKVLSDDKFDKSGGTIAGNLTVNGTTTLNKKVTAKAGIDVTGDSKFKNNVDVTGILNMSNSIRSTKAEFLQTQAPVVKGTKPSSTTYNYWSVFDKNGWSVNENRLAHIDYTVDTNGVASLAMYVNKYVAGSTETGAGIYARWNGDNAIIAATHHPLDTANDYSLTTAYWVNQRINNNKTQLVRW